MSLIELKNITKTYNSTAVPVHALKDVSLNIEQKEFTSIVGPSGSGKTTLLNILGGLDKPTKGQVTIAEKEITSMKTGKLVDFRLNNIGFVFQAYNLIPVLTALENVEFIMLLQNVSKQERRQRAESLMIELLPLAANYSVAPISSYHVGAVIRGAENSDGSANLYFGANFEFEDQALGHSLHAEQSAISNAWLNGETSVTALAISSSKSSVS